MVARTEQLASPRILAGVTGSIEVLVYQDGALVDPEASPAPSCVVTNAHGETVSTGTATIVGGGSGKLRYDLTAVENARPAVLTATWSFEVPTNSARTVVTTHEALGELLFTLAQARAHDAAVLASSASYPDEAILRYRDLILDAFTDVCGRTWGARYGRQVLDGTGRGEIALVARDVSAVRTVSERASGSATLTAYGLGELADVLVYPDGRLVRETLGTFASGRRNVVVEFEHGVAPIPLEIREAALRLLRDQIVPSNLPDRATSQSNEFGAFSLSTAGMRGAWFGIPRVDSVLDRYRRRLPGVA